MAQKTVKARSNSTASKTYRKVKKTAEALGPKGVAQAIGNRLFKKSSGAKTVKAKKRK